MSIVSFGGKSGMTCSLDLLFILKLKRRNNILICLEYMRKMSIQIENNLINSGNKDIFEQKAHYVPCNVKEDGPANVEKYFEPYVTEHNGELKATFRGHPLDGTKMNFPEGYRAIVVTEAKRPLAEDAERKFQVAGGFKEFTYWNWDKKPSRNDSIIKAFDWIEIAEAIHGD